MPRGQKIHLTAKGIKITKFFRLDFLSLVLCDSNIFNVLGFAANLLGPIRVGSGCCCWSIKFLQSCCHDWFPHDGYVSQE